MGCFICAKIVLSESPVLVLKPPVWSQREPMNEAHLDFTGSLSLSVKYTALTHAYLTSSAIYLKQIVTPLHHHTHRKATNMSHLSGHLL